MPNGRGRGGGRGFRPYGVSYGMGSYWLGRGNPYPFCRNFPWLPRWWWAGQYAATSPYVGGYGYPMSAPYAGTYAPAQPVVMR